MKTFLKKKAQTSSNDTTGSPSSIYEPQKYYNMALNYKALYGVFLQDIHGGS